MTPRFPYRNAILVYAFWAFPIINLLFALRYFIRLSKGQPDAKPFVAIHVAALIIFLSFIIYLLPKIE
jgi:heme/copper-type cytochrome/quinol oxidase subunit 4